MDNESDQTFFPSSQQRYTTILEWLYTNDKAYDDHVKWRTALIAKLKEVLL